MIHEIRQRVQLIAWFELRTDRSWTYRDRYCFVIPHAQHERSLGIGAQHKWLIALVEVSEHEKRNIAHPKGFGRFIAIRVGADWILRMGPRNRQASGYELKSHLLPPHFSFGSDRFQEGIPILICHPDNQITIRMSLVKFTQLRYSSAKFLFIQEQIACIVVELSLFQHRAGKRTMSFAAVALDKKIKIPLYYRDAAVRVMTEFSEYIVRSPVH